MKLRKLHIEDYKMFKDFDISFVDENDEALPIVVLAGVNGSGKTTLLEFIFDFKNLDNTNNSELEIYENSKSSIIKKKSLSSGFAFKFDEYEINENDIVFFSVDTNITNIKDFLPKFIENMVYQEEIPPAEVYRQVREFMTNILEELNPQIEFDSRDGAGNLFFRDRRGGDKFSIDNLSTGEKTLVSKVLHLYLEDIKDKIILIDEPELSLHPSWQNKVLKIYENFAIKNNCQIIIATHSPHIIGSAKPEYIRVLKKVEDKIEVVEYTQSYGLEFSQILTNIMGVDYLRTPNVAKKMANVKEMIVQNKYDADEFKKEWEELEEMLGNNYLDLKLLKLEIASRRKNASNN